MLLVPKTFRLWYSVTFFEDYKLYVLRVFVLMGWLTCSNNCYFLTRDTIPHKTFKCDSIFKYVNWRCILKVIMFQKICNHISCGSSWSATRFPVMLWGSQKSEYDMIFHHWGRRWFAVGNHHRLSMKDYFHSPTKIRSAVRRVHMFWCEFSGRPQPF